MVNELNKPPGDNAALSQRLAASNRQLQEMQEEHRQLLQEMETLRARAAELTRLNAERQHLREVADNGPAAVAAAPASVEPHPPLVSTAETQLEEAKTVTEVTSTNAAINEEDNATEECVDKEETASYLQQKLNEIANLKAQFKRVQHMVDTTKLIEQHMSSRSEQTSTVKQATQTQTTTEEESTAATTETIGAATAPPVDNAELLNAMLNMFTDFTSDLRGQAEGLRAERERIKTLKEDIMRRKQGK